MKEPILLEKFYVFLVWILERIAKFPKGYKYILGGRLSGKCFDFLDGCIEAYNRASDDGKGTSLRGISIDLDRIRYYVRLSKDMKLLSIDQYGYTSEKLNEIGKIVGGWLKARLKEK